jgi:hypothetical protein
MGSYILIIYTPKQLNMFKSKIDFNAFDTNNDKVKDLEPNKVKALAKASVKKLLAQPEVRTPFHLILDYFKDDQEKPQGHFLGLGVNKKLDKHFEQVEMKSGKLDKSMSASQKEAAMGEAYSKEENGKKILCIEPHPGVKVPKGKWAKILKGLKPYLAGAKAVVVFEGQTIGDEEGDTATDEETTETGTEEQGETGADTETNVEEQGETTTDEASTDSSDEDAPNLIEQFKAQLAEISTGLTQTLPKEIVPKIKARSVEANDLDVVQQLKTKMEEFEEAFQGAAENIQKKLSKMRNKINKQLDKVDKILKAVELVLKKIGGEETTEETEEDTSVLDKLLKTAEKSLGNYRKVYDKLKKDLEESEEEPIEGGSDLLDRIER